MPKLIDYAERFDDIRRAVCTIALRDGAASITLPTVAREIGLSEMTVRRLMPSARHLPELGLQLIARHERARIGWPVPGELAPDSPWAQRVNDLLRELPCTQDRADDARAWRVITQGFIDKPWARAERNNYQLYLAALADRAVPDDVPPADRPFEVLRLHILLTGTIESVCTGGMGPEESVPLLRRHLEPLASACLDRARSGAA